MAEKKVIKYFKGKVRSIDVEKKTADVVISDETKDRYDERVLVGSFKKTKKEFMKHAVLLSSHAYHGLQNQIGKFTKLSIDEKEKEVVGTVEYFYGLGNPEADWAWVLAEKGIAAFSIGFIPKIKKDYDDDEMKKNGGVWREYEDIELLEVSQVLIPANPSALQKSFDSEDDLFLKDLSEQIVKAFEDDSVEDGVVWEEEVPEVQKMTVTAEEVLRIATERYVDAMDEISSLKASLEEVKQTLTTLMASMAEGKSLTEQKEETDLGEESKEADEGKTETETKDGSGDEQVESIEEVLGPEKLAELKGSLFGYTLADNDSLKSLFDTMNAEIKEKLSVQS